MYVTLNECFCTAFFVCEGVLSRRQWLLPLVDLDVRTCSFFVLCPAVDCCMAILGLCALLRRTHCLSPLNILKCKTFFLGFVFSWYIFTIFANKHLARKKNESRFVCSMLC